jgi:hypothetical protein
LGSQPSLSPGEARRRWPCSQKLRKRFAALGGRQRQGKGDSHMSNQLPDASAQSSSLSKYLAQRPKPAIETPEPEKESVVAPEKPREKRSLIVWASIPLTFLMLLLIVTNFWAEIIRSYCTYTRKEFSPDKFSILREGDTTKKAIETVGHPLFVQIGRFYGFVLILDPVPVAIKPRAHAITSISFELTSNNKYVTKADTYFASGVMIPAGTPLEEATPLFKEEYIKYLKMIVDTTIIEEYRDEYFSELSKENDFIIWQYSNPTKINYENWDNYRLSIKNGQIHKIYKDIPFISFYDEIPPVMNKIHHGYQEFKFWANCFKFW